MSKKLTAEDAHFAMIQAELLGDVEMYRSNYERLKAEIQRSVSARRYAEKWVAHPVLTPDQFARVAAAEAARFDSLSCKINAA